MIISVTPNTKSSKSVFEVFFPVEVFHSMAQSSYRRQNLFKLSQLPYNPGGSCSNSNNKRTPKGSASGIKR